MKQVAIMNYITQEIHIFDVEKEEDITMGDLGFRESDCHWMWGEDIKVVHHKEVVK